MFLESIELKIGDILEVNKTFFSILYVSLWGKKYDFWLSPSEKRCDIEADVFISKKGLKFKKGLVLWG